MKKDKTVLGVLFLVMFLFMPCANALPEQFFGIGAELFQDPFNKKIIITSIIPNSPMQKANVTAGSEIVSVDGFKVRKSCLCDTISRIRGQQGTSLKLVIRNGWKWKTIELTRELITVDNPDINTNFEMYWQQVAPVCYHCTKFIPKEITDKFSRKYRKTVLPVVHYWLDRKSNFERGYNSCLTYSKNNQELCLINLLNRENQTTLTDKKLYKVLRNKPE